MTSLQERIVRHSPSAGPRSAGVWGIFDPPSGSAQYVVACPSTRQAAIIDPVQGFDMASCRTDDDAAEQIIDLVQSNGLDVRWVLDTHPHADHLTASHELKTHFAAANGIGEKVRDIAALWRDFYNLPDAFDVERHYDRLFADGDMFQLGALPVEVMLHPGHTLGSISYKIGGDAAFIHDTLMQPDRGTARCDFPGGSAEALWDAIQSILSMADDTRLFIGHDYPDDARTEPQWEATVSDHRAHNIHVADGVEKAQWIARRQKRDATLPLPQRMLAALQINLRAGKLPETESDGHAYIKLPLNRF
ncbi:MAG: MBL fold metallo-hydrolase [Pseudomonadota bacterium]